MLEPPLALDPEVQQRLRLIRTLHAGMVLGIVAFAAIAGVMTQQGGGGSAPAPTGLSGQPVPDINIFRIIVGALTLSAVVAAVMIRRITISRLAASEQPPTDAVFANTYFTAVLIGLAVAEGAALFACITVLMSKNLGDLGLVAAPLVLMLILTPTRSRWEDFRQRVLNDRALRTDRS